MKLETITLRFDPRGFAEITMNRPEKHNAFNDVLIEELRDALTRVAKINECRFLVLKGQGRSFSSGADLNWMKSMAEYSRKENVKDSEKLSALFDELDCFEKPLIGIVKGYALGGGAGLVAVCDYVLASSRSQFGFSEVKLGLVPAVISPYVLSKIGLSYAKALFISGIRFSGEQALEIGLVHQIEDPEDMEQAELDLLDQFLTSGPEAMVKAKELLRSISDSGGRVENKIRKYCIQTIADLRVSQEGQEGMQSMLNKRPPRWIPGSS